MDWIFLLRINSSFPISSRRHVWSLRTPANSIWALRYTSSKVEVGWIFHVIQWKPTVIQYETKWFLNCVRKLNAHPAVFSISKIEFWSDRLQNHRANGQIDFRGRFFSRSKNISSEKSYPRKTRPRDRSTDQNQQLCVDRSIKIIYYVPVNWSIIFE